MMLDTWPLADDAARLGELATATAACSAYELTSIPPPSTACHQDQSTRTGRVGHRRDNERPVASDNSRHHFHACDRTYPTRLLLLHERNAMTGRCPGFPTRPLCLDTQVAIESDGNEK